MTQYTDKPMLGADFIASCIDYADNEHLRTAHVRAARNYSSDGGWMLARDNSSMSTWRQQIDNQRHEIHWLHPYLVAPKGGVQKFKTLDAAQREAQRLATMARASLEFSVSTRFYAHEHTVAA